MFLTTGAVTTDIKEKEKFADKHFHNILRFFDVLPDFLAPNVKRCAIITYKHGIYKLPQNRTELGNIRKVSKLYIENDSLVSSLPAKMNILLILAKNS